jgi:hypothetical protein
MWLLVLLLVLAVLAFGAWMLVLAVSAIVALAVKLLPVLMIVAGLWLVWLAIRDGLRSRRAERPDARAAEHVPADSDAEAFVAAGVHGQSAVRPAPLPKRELPIDVQVKVEQIQRKSDVLLGYADRFPPFSQSLHIVRQTAADYLPRTIDAYLALPGDTDPVVPTTGKTALAELREQLHLLDAKLDDITLDLQQQDLDRMSANRRFLEERFGAEDQREATGSPEGKITAA